MEILIPLKWMGIFLISLVWVYMAARMIGRAFSRTLEELWPNKRTTNLKKGERNGEKEEQKKE